MEVYAEFIRLHPKSKEVFILSDENLKRWRWHIENIKAMPHLERIEINGALARDWADARKFYDFSELPKYMKTRYSILSSLFPDRQVYACGSRINGEYVEDWSGPEVDEMRAQLMKQVKRTSDYDFFMDIPPKEPIPEWADFVLRTERKIEIPMWDFSKLPESEYENVKELYEAQDWSKLILIHNKYQLSFNSYCCDEAPVKRWYKWIIDGINDKTEPGTI